MGIEDILGEILKGTTGFGAPQGQPQHIPNQRDGRPHTPRTQPIPAPRLPKPSEPHDPNCEGGIGHVMRAVVQVVALRKGFLGGTTTAWTGSGTIVHPAGLVLTNCHVANPRAMGMSSPPADRLAIAINEQSDQAPALTYFAQIVAEDPKLDLAVLRIVADVQGRRINNLNLPAVALGDSDDLDLGDRLAIFGFPGIGGETITFTSGNVSGFGSERGVQEPRAWVKTDATIAGGNSGGTATNHLGQLVGIPTQAAAGSGINPVDARPVVDTNRDGRIDHRDTPMAVGGFINGLRPINLAYPLLRKAGMEIRVDSPGRVTREPSIFGGRDDSANEWGFPRHRKVEQPEFSHLVFSAGITDDGRPINPTEMVSADHHTVYATFEFDGMQHGMPWSVVWQANGQTIIEANGSWDDGEEGNKTVKVSNQTGLPPGEYHLILGLNGRIGLEGNVNVGTPIDERDAEISGAVVDADTNQGIANAVVLVLKPGVNTQQFLKSRDERLIYVNTETDQHGKFVLPKQLPKGQAYGVIAAARGYRLVNVDGGLRVNSRAPEQVNAGAIPLHREA